jgi:glycine/D-amino acid oxidase-like deaminating enzyme
VTPEKRIAVVGAGAFGSWIALLAVRAGFDTVLIDRYGPGNELSSSAGSSRIIRRTYGADEIYTLFAQRSLELWTSFFASENRSHCFRPTGVLWLADEVEPAVHAARKILERHQIAHEFLEAHAIRGLFREMDVPTGPSHCLSVMSAPCSRRSRYAR